jgi:muramoyltetrapeptide carboxypeptidase
MDLTHTTGSGMGITRRSFLGMAGAAAGAAALPPLALHARAERGDAVATVRPRRLREGDTVALVSPGSPVAEDFGVQLARESFEAMGLRVRLGRSVRERRGYLAGSDADRAADLNELFADASVDALFALRGGWGSARILPLLNFDLIRRNPKILLGYSDITALLNAIHARTGLVTFHGPMGVSRWTEYPLSHLRRLLFDAEAMEWSNPVDTGGDLVQRDNRVRTITPGTARGTLVGGNLSVLAGIVGSGFVPRWDGSILFLEDVDEGIHRMDRMLTQLALAGVLGSIRGFVFGRCTSCDPQADYGSLTLEQVLADHVAPLGIPAWSGAMIGHVTDQWTLPVGAEVEIDAARGTIRLLEPAVV